MVTGIIIILLSKVSFFFFREILAVMNEHGSILEVIVNDNSFCCAALNLLCSVHCVTVPLYLATTTAVS